MIDSMALETVPWVIVSGAVTVVAAAIGAPAGACVSGGWLGRFAEIVAVGAIRILAPTLLAFGALAALTNSSVQITFTATTMAAVQCALALVVMTGSTVRAMRLLPQSVFDQLDALQLGRATSLRLLLVEVWTRLLSGAARAFALSTLAVGSALLAGGLLGDENRIGVSSIVGASGRPEREAGLVLVGISLVVLSIVSAGRSR